MASRLKYQSMVNHLLSIFILTQVSGFLSFQPNSHPIDKLIDSVVSPTIKVINLSYVASLAPQIKDLKVQCDSDGMEVNVTFDSPFNGIIFSKGYYNDMGCRYVQEKSGSSNLAFKIPAEGCGTASVLSKDVKDSKQFENVIIFQNDPIYQEVWDSARLLSCRYSLQRDLPVQEKRVVFKPFLVDMLDVIRVPMADFAGDEHKVDCWMDVTKGRYPNNSPIDGPVKVGENLTLAIYIRDTRKRTDIRVKDCYAYDNEESVNDKSPALLQLSGEDGCPLKPKLMDVWKRTTTGAQDATVLAYSTVTAFKFPEHSNVHLTCNVELCKNQCADRCSLEAKDIANKKGEASMDGDDEMSKSSEGKSDGEDDEDDSSSNKNDESDVKPVSISTKAAPAPKSDSTKSEDDEDEDSNADEEAKTETTSAKPTTASSVKDADEDEDAASEDAAEGSTSERGGRKSDGEDNEEGTDEETSVGSSTSTSTTTSTTTAKPSEDEDEEEDKSDEEDEDKKSETSPITTTSTTSTTSTTTTTTTTEKPSERSEDDEEDEDGVDDSDTDSRKRSLRPAKAEGKSIADDEDEDEEDNSSKLISFKAKQSMKTKAEASEDEDYDDDLQSSRGSSTSVSPVTTTTTPIPKTPLIIVIKPEKSRKKIKEAARRGRIESRSRQAVRSSSSKLGSSRSISSQVSREPCCSDVTTTSSRSDRKSTTSTTKSPITTRSSSGRSVRRSSRFDEPDSENVSNLQSKSQRSSRQSKKQAKTSTATTTTSTTVAPKKIKTTSTKRPRRRSTTTTTTTTTTPRTTTESDEDKEETEAPRTFRKSTRKPKRPVVRTRKSLTDRLFIPHSNDRQTTPKTVTTTISPSISSSSTFRIASNRFSTHRSNPYLRSTLKPATIPSSRNSLRLTSSSTVAPPKRLADFDEFKDNEALIENEKPDRNRIKPSSSAAATGTSRRWDGDELFNPFKEIEYEPVRLNNNRNQRRRRSLYTLFNDQHTDEKLSNYNMPIIF